MASTPLLRLSLPPQHHHKPTFLLHALKPHFLPYHHRAQQISTRPPSPSTTTPLHKKAIRSSYSPPTPATDRLISAASYFLPFFNGLQYGRFLFTQFPVLALPFQPLLPLLSLYRSLPYASFVTFFALYLGVVRNETLSRYVRFNALQALVLDVLLVLPMLVQRIISPGRSGLGLKLTIWAHNAIFVFVVACFVYGLVCSVLGKTPYLPFVAEAAGRQL